MYCKKCGKEIENGIAFCPYCGSPIASRDEETINQIDTADLKEYASEPECAGTPSTSAKKKKNLIFVAVVSAVCVVAAIVTGIAINNKSKEKAAAEARQAYIDTLEDFLSTSLSGGAQAETVCNFTKRVWRDTIYEEYDTETAPYTKTNGKFNDDFNTSLQTLYGSDYMAGYIESIQSNQSSVEALYKELLNPTEEFDKCFEEVEELYSVYYRFTNLALSPTGSLQTYSQNFSNLDSEFMEHYEKLEILIPEE